MIVELDCWHENGHCFLPTGGSLFLQASDSSTPPADLPGVRYEVHRCHWCGAQKNVEAPAPEEQEDRTVSDYPWTEHIPDESRPNPGRRNSRMALAAASALASLPEPLPVRRERNPGATGSSYTKQSQRKSKRRAKGKAQRRARKVNRR